MCYNALGLRSEEIMAKPVIKFRFTGITEIAHVDLSVEHAETQVGFCSAKVPQIFSGINWN